MYEDLLDFKSLKGFMESQLEDYNLTPGVVPMSLVLFKDAIEHGQLSCLIIPISQHTVAQVSYSPVFAYTAASAICSAPLKLLFL